MEQTPKERLAAVMAELGLTITAEFVPWSQSRSKDDRVTDSAGKPTKRPRYSLNWRVTLLRRRTHGPIAESSPVLTTDYSAGIGHCPSYEGMGKKGTQAYRRPGTLGYDEAIKLECETGKPARLWPGDGIGVASGAPTILPDPCDVMASLVLDSSVLDAGGFEEWASEYGYDTDSRKAESIYRACLETALKLRAAVGDDGLAKLRAAAQEY